MRRPFFTPELFLLEDRINPATLELLNSGATLLFTPGDNVANVLIVSTTAATITIEEQAEAFTTIPDGWSFTEGGNQKVEGPRGDITKIRCDAMGPENDYLNGTGSDIPLDFRGALGDDTLYGGTANDTLNGGVD